MKKIAFAAILVIPALVACSEPFDNPSTIPVAGKWVGDAKLMSISVNGMAIDPTKSAPLNEILSRISKQEEICGEPQNLNEEEFQKKMGSDKLANCTIDSSETKGNRLSEQASCDVLNLPGTTDRMRLTSETVFNPDKVTSDMTMSFTARKPSGEGMIMKMEFSATMTRLGDC
jgi:Protein of unknown function (DUF3617)